MKKCLTVILSAMLTLSMCACGKDEEKIILPAYENHDFVISGFWAPYKITEESYRLYRDSGLNTLLMVNHSATPRSSENQYFLGSVATEKALQTCRNVGLNAILNYNDWIAESLGVHYSRTPFSDNDLYEEYKDMIRGVHIADEPGKEKISIYGGDELTADFSKVYENKSYFINLLPIYATREQTGFDDYRDYLEYYIQNVLVDFSGNRLLSVDFYPFPAEAMRSEWLYCYDLIARLARDYGTELNFYIQCAEGKEFRKYLTEEEIRMQVYVALCFGGSWISYYCYSNPLSDGGMMYDACMVDADGQPTDLYEFVRTVNDEISSFSDVILSYDWQFAAGVPAEGTRGGTALRMLENSGDFSACNYLDSIVTSGDLVVGCFKDEENSEGYMIVNYCDPAVGQSAEITVNLMNSDYAAVYGRLGSTENPLIVETEEGCFQTNLDAGDGIFVVPLTEI